jgi:hypothetical protein
MGGLNELFYKEDRTPREERRQERAEILAAVGKEI